MDRPKSSGNTENHQVQAMMINKVIVRKNHQDQALVMDRPKSSTLLDQ
jgi:hypothetical protein